MILEKCIGCDKCILRTKPWKIKMQLIFSSFCFSELCCCRPLHFAWGQAMVQVWGSLIACKIHCLNSLIFIYFQVVYCALHVFWLIFHCVSGTEDVKSRIIKKEVKRATWASNDIMLTSHPIEISKTEWSYVQQQKLPKKLRFYPNPFPHLWAQVWGIQLQIEWYKRGSADEKKDHVF